jgi:hypothetical protein
MRTTTIILSTQEFLNIYETFRLHHDNQELDNLGEEMTEDMMNKLLDAEDIAWNTISSIVKREGL